MKPTAKTLARIEEHVRLFHLATIRSVCRSVCAGDDGAARACLDALVASGRLHRRRWGDDGLEYFTMRVRPYQASEFRQRLAVLQFSACQPMLRPLLPPTRFREVLVPVTDHAGIPTPAWHPCYLYRPRKDQAQRLSLIRVGARNDLQSAVEELDQFVASAAFKPWWYFAAGGHFQLTYLLPGPRDSADELGRWLRRRPPLCRFGPKPTPIAMVVHEARGMAA